MFVARNLYKWKRINKNNYDKAVHQASPQASTRE